MTGHAPNLASTDQHSLDANADAEPAPCLFKSTDLPELNPTLVRGVHCDLWVVGRGDTGLCTAALAQKRDPACDVVLIDVTQTGHQESYVAALRKEHDALRSKGQQVEWLDTDVPAPTMATSTR